MRNVIAHEYFGVTDETLWKTVREDLPSIIEPLPASPPTGWGRRASPAEPLPSAPRTPRHLDRTRSFC